MGRECDRNCDRGASTVKLATGVATYADVNAASGNASQKEEDTIASPSQQVQMFELCRYAYDNV